MEWGGYGMRVEMEVVEEKGCMEEEGCVEGIESELKRAPVELVLGEEGNAYDEGSLRELSG